MTGVLAQLLVATDGSETGDRAVSFAIAVARRHRSELLFCYAVDRAGVIAECSMSTGGFGLMPPLQALDDAAASIVADAAKRAAEAGVVATTAILDGRSAQAIVECANERKVDAIVMGTQGKRGFEHFFLGSTAEGVLRHTALPTFVVPPGASDLAPARENILVAADDSDPSDAAVGFALELAEADGVRLVFCGVAETNDLLDKAATYGYDPTAMLAELRATAAALVTPQAERARTRNLAYESVVVDGDPAEKILESAVARRCGLIVVGTHGRRGLRRLFVGSVAESIVRRSTVPVAVVRIASARSGHAAGTMPLEIHGGSARA